MLGLTQERLGSALGLTFQQVQKYERGGNRIGASRLLELARVLDVPVTFFFDDVDPVRAPAIPKGLAPERAEADDLQREETVDLVAAYFEILDTKLRRRLFELAKALSKAGSTPSEVAAAVRRRGTLGRKRRRTSGP